MYERKRGMPSSQEDMMNSNRSLEVDSSHSDTPLSESGRLDSLIRSRARLSQISRRPLPIITTIVAVVLTLLGTIFLVLGLSFYFTGKLAGGDKGIALTVLGGLMFIPGSYASFIIYGSWAGWSGFDFSQIPSYDDE